MVLAISSLSRGSLSDKLRWMFHLYDANADGFISRQELKNVIVAANRLGGNGSYITPSSIVHLSHVALPIVSSKTTIYQALFAYCLDRSYTHTHTQQIEKIKKKVYSIYITVHY